MQTRHLETIKALQVLDNEARQVKHTMHYLGSLYCFLRHRCILLLCLVCLYWFFFLHWKLLFFLQRDEICVFLYLRKHMLPVHVRVDGAPLSFLLIFFLTPSTSHSLFPPFVLALCRLCAHGACQTVWVCRNDNGPRSGVSAGEMGIGYF